MKPRSVLTFVFSSPIFAVLGARPTATRSFSASTSSVLPFDERDLHLHACAGLLNITAFRAGLDTDFALFKDALEFLRNFFVFNRHQAGQHFEDGNVRAEALEHGRELDAHRPRANDHQRFRHRAQVEDFDVGEDEFGVGLQAGEHAGFGAGGDQDVLRFERLRAFAAVDLDFARPFDAWRSRR